MRTFAKTTAVLLTLGALSGFTGCALIAGAAIGAGTAAYVGGDLEGRFEASPQKVVQASETSLKEMDIKVLSANSTEIDGKVVGRTAQDKKIEITIDRDGDAGSKVAIRVDTFGDEALSRQIYDKIQANLG